MRCEEVVSLSCHRIPMFFHRLIWTLVNPAAFSDSPNSFSHGLVWLSICRCMGLEVTCLPTEL
ncbi:hypothetical protein GCWU000342_00571 [Shuttleworthella satelles DSM 14600]|uniref:Uncharacterized protein n=1 Tax=Shuttleworthella satelles DSM 14600 TaxID=626523 RepID=C4G9C0_9FIRM|nr:hypothetical protein GCWU000342_00571 [Shuttleworthia satelles DSM 14600]